MHDIVLLPFIPVLQVEITIKAMVGTGQYSVIDPISINMTMEQFQ